MFGKVGCVLMVIDFVLLEMFEIVINFKFEDEWWDGMIIDKFIVEMDVVLKFLGVVNFWMMLIKVCIDMLVIGICMFVGIKFFGMDFE